MKTIPLLLAFATLLPIPMTVAEIAFGQMLYQHLTSAFTAGDPAFNDAYTTVGRIVMLSHWILTPIISILILAAALILPRRERLGLHPVNMFLLIPLAALFIALQCATFVIILIPRFFTT